LIYQSFLLFLIEIYNVMKPRKPLLLPKAQRILEAVGENIKLARLRRKLSTAQIAERANISRSTLWLVEKGNPGVAIGTYLQVMFVLGLEKDFLNLVQDDVLGRKLQDATLLPKQRAPKRPPK
jgi:transcriptional regulator with XRE-family HTH domain